jgi:hypothetical protein
MNIGSWQVRLEIISYAQTICMHNYKIPRACGDSKKHAAWPNICVLRPSQVVLENQGWPYFRCYIIVASKKIATSFFFVRLKFLSLAMVDRVIFIGRFYACRLHL